MSGFFEGGVANLASAVLMRRRPIYVQYYVTARCNLRCLQCNVIYANGDQEEASTADVGLIADNLAAIGTSIVLLTGGEPFVRKDLVEIAGHFIRAGVHPRLQTNGLASTRDLERLADIGAHDISISLDTLAPAMQDEINGGFDASWRRAIDTIAAINQTFPPDSFCALGCVLTPTNLDEVIPLIHFASRIGWWVSLVPAHQSPATHPRSFATYDASLRFPSEQHGRLRAVLDAVIDLKRQGANLYDSHEYLEDIYRFCTGSPTRWRRRNGGSCDSPNLYFAIQPNGEMAVCCDYRLSSSYPVQDPDFPSWFDDRVMWPEARKIAGACSGCMYGSYPEITISARFYRPMIERAKLFMAPPRQRRLIPMSGDEMTDIASQTRAEFIDA